MASEGAGRAIDEATVDASRRTRLANERTYLAWLRGGLTTLAVAVGAGAVAPELTDDGARWPFVVLGVAFAALAISFIAYGVVRHRQVEEAIDRGGFSPLPSAMAALFGTIGVILALLTIIVVAIEA
jgi:putative membrane protein